MTDGPAPFLVNCMNEDVYVLVNGERVLLPRGIVPALLHAPSGRTTMQIQVLQMLDEETAGDEAAEAAAGGEGSRVVGPAELEYYTSTQTFGLLQIPPHIPGVLNLVEAETLRQFPWRDDFVTPAVWTYAHADIDTDDVDSLSDEELGEMFSRRHSAVLSGVTRSLDPVADPDAEVLEWSERTVRKDRPAT